MRIRSWMRCAVLLCACAVPGCGLTPQFREAPGTILYQRSRAVVHDPFPDNSIGPSVMGGRPFGFDRPLAEPAKLQSTSPASRPAF